jgi:hypothetical protein
MRARAAAAKCMITARVNVHTGVYGTGASAHRVMRGKEQQRWFEFDWGGKSRAGVNGPTALERYVA